MSHFSGPCKPSHPANHIVAGPSLRFIYNYQSRKHALKYIRSGHSTMLRGPDGELSPSRTGSLLRYAIRSTNYALTNLRRRIMAQLATSTYKRSIAALGLGAALMMALTGCLGGSADSDSKPAESAAAQGTNSSAKESALAARDSEVQKLATETPSASAKASATKAAAPAAGATGALTPPGTALKFGQVAKTHTNSGEKDTEKYKEATFDTTVTKIVAGDPADLSEFKDAAKFAGQTPYYVFFDSKLTSLSKPSAGMSEGSLNAHLKDGTEAQKLIVFGTMADCESGSFDTEGKDDAFSYVVGSTKSSCSVFLAPAGDEITSASYAMTSFNYEKYSDNKYLKNPITWSK